MGSFLSSHPLTFLKYSLELNGIKASQFRRIFALGFNGAALRHLVLYDLSSRIELVHFRAIFKCSPESENLKVNAEGWGPHMVRRSVREPREYRRLAFAFFQTQFAQTLAKDARNLKFLEFDHPWEYPRESGLPTTPDGRAIRTDRNQDFKVISVAGQGNTIKKEIISRINADIEAVKPVYVKRFQNLATVCARLEQVIWRPTDEVVSTGTFFRCEEGNVKKFRQKAVVKYTGGPSDDAPVAGGRAVLLRVRSEAAPAQNSRVYFT